MRQQVSVSLSSCNLRGALRHYYVVGNAFEKAKVHNFVSNFKGVVCIDEAYADFCEDNCLDMVKTYPNVVVTRSLSKSYSLAGMRCGLGLGSPKLILGMHKVRDSYNVNHITQGRCWCCYGEVWLTYLLEVAAAAALLDTDSFNKNTVAIKATRDASCKKLEEMGKVI